MVFFVISLCFQCVHLPEVYDDVDAGVTGRLRPWVQTGVPVAVLALLRERVHHFPLPRAGEDNNNNYCDDEDDNFT